MPNGIWNGHAANSEVIRCLEYTGVKQFWKLVKPTYGKQRAGAYLPSHT